MTTLLLIDGSHSDSRVFDAMSTDRAAGPFTIDRAATLADAGTYLTSKTPDCVVLAGPSGALPENVIHALAARSTAAFVVLTDRDEDALCWIPDMARLIDYLPASGMDHKFLSRFVRHAIERRQLQTSLAEVQGIARVGTWAADIVDNHLDSSAEFRRLYGVAAQDQPALRSVVARIHPDDRMHVVRAIRATIEAASPLDVDHRILLPEEGVRWIRLLGRVVARDAGRPTRVHGTAQDVTELKAVQEAAAKQSLHDALTGLPNRLLLDDRLGQALAKLARLESTVGVIHLGVDRFKVINDSLGYRAGEQLLLSLAERLTELIRPEDTLARIRPDEFVVLCEGLSDEAEAVLVADRICAAMTQPLTWQGPMLVVSVSAGIAISTSAATVPDALLRDAEAAMYRARSPGHARSTVFAESMRANSVSRLETEVSLREAIANGDLRVHYQPIVALLDGQVTGHEALVRWAHPERGLVGPDQFISIAEETGLIVPLGAWVLREACAQAKRFQMRDPRWSHLTMSVNLSGGQLGQPDLNDMIVAALRDADLRPEHLQLEMTESVLMDDASATITILEKLKGLGVALGVDDFGTGYSSLAYLRRFPVDVLKIDRAFVDGLGKDVEDMAIVAAIASLADTLGFSTIAEGVETELQRQALMALGCSRAQGYLFARPMWASAAEAALDVAARQVPAASLR